MLRSIAVAAMSVCLLATPVRATGADYREWSFQCFPGSSACISFSLAFEYSAAIDATWITVDATNHQGAPGFGPSDPFGIYWLSWTGLSYELPAWMQGVPESQIHGMIAVQSFGDAGWTNTSTHPTLTPINESFSWLESALFASPSSGSLSLYGLNGEIRNIWGCDAPQSDQNHFETFGFYSTCGDGFLRFTYKMSGKLAFTSETQADFYLRTSDITQNALGRCFVGIDCVTVPEPSALLLLAPALLGMTYVQSRRGSRRIDFEPPKLRPLAP